MSRNGFFVALALAWALACVPAAAFASEVSDPSGEAAATPAGSDAGATGVAASGDADAAPETPATTASALEPSAPTESATTASAPASGEDASAASSEPASAEPSETSDGSVANADSAAADSTAQDATADDAAAQDADAQTEAEQGAADTQVAEEPVTVAADDPADAAAGEGTGAAQNVSYDYNAPLYTPTTDENGVVTGGDYPGVYATKIEPNNATAADAPTIGMPSIADANLPDVPTYESPAIIQGAAVGYEERLGPAEYKKLKDRPDPYSEFTVSIMEEKAQDGTVHKKPTGFDGTYVITRLDVSSFFENGNENAYLHVKQEKNNALMVNVGMVDNNKGFSDGMGNKTAAYRLADLIDAAGVRAGTNPYLDIIMLSTGKLLAGADAGKANAATGDIPLQMYVDNTFDYNPSLKYNATSTDPNHATQCLAKFFDASKVDASKISRYTVKGSDIALETVVENSGGENKDTGSTYWSLNKSLVHPYYDQPADLSPEDPACGRTVKLITEVPIVGNLALEGTDANNLKKRTLNVNSFDIQVANNTTTDEKTYSSGLTLKNAWLTIQDKSNTTGAEMAIGNNAKFTIDQDGKLIIDETCQLEIEFDAATVTPAADGTTPKPDILNNGMLDLRAGGEIVNNGIITIEGTEGKPFQPGANEQQVIESLKGEGILTIEQGATLTNNGSLMIYGHLNNLGTLINNGRYNETIVSNDPDKGLYAYHKGIILSWKDDVTQQNVVFPMLYNGMGPNGEESPNATIVNNGDILANPGIIYNWANIENGPSSNIYLAVATEAIIPIQPDPKTPTITTKRITLKEPQSSFMVNFGNLTNEGNIVPASVVLNDNGSTGAISVPGNHANLFGFPEDGNFGTVDNRGYIYGWADPIPADSGEQVPGELVPGKTVPENAKPGNAVSKVRTASPAAGKAVSPKAAAAVMPMTADSGLPAAFVALALTLLALAGAAMARRKVQEG